MNMKRKNFVENFEWGFKKWKKSWEKFNQRLQHKKLIN